MKKIATVLTLGISLLSLTAFADGNENLYQCELSASTENGIPEFKKVMTVSTTNRQKLHSVLVEAYDFLNGGDRIKILGVELKNRAIYEGPVFSGMISGANDFSISITKDVVPTDRVQVQPSYTAITQMAGEDVEIWACISPQDPV